MFAKIVGIVLLVMGVGLALSAIVGVVAGTFALALLAVKAALVVGVCYMGCRWVGQEGVALKMLGVLLLLGSVYLALPVAGALILGAFGVMGLAVKVVVSGVLLYCGWRWVTTGRFTISGQRDSLGI